MFLLSAVVFAGARDPQAKKVAIEFQTGFSITDYDRSMIDPQKQFVGSMPFRIALALGKLKDFEPVFVRIAKVKSFDAAGVLVPIRQTLRTG